MIEDLRAAGFKEAARAAEGALPYATQAQAQARAVVELARTIGGHFADAYRRVNA